MKNLVLILSLAAISLGFSSCCKMFSMPSLTGEYRTETRKVRACGYDTVTEEVYVGSGKSGMVQTVEKKVPRYKTVTKRVRVRCGSCARFYCPKSGCCGTTSEKTLRMATVQGSTGSPHVGLIPTMKPLAP